MTSRESKCGSGPAAVLIDAESVHATKRTNGGIPVPPLLRNLERGLHDELGVERVAVIKGFADFVREQPMVNLRKRLAKHGVETIQVDDSMWGDHGNADVGLAVDAVRIAFDRPMIRTIAIVSGQPDSLVPLVDVLHRLSISVIGVMTGAGDARSFLDRCDASLVLPI